jgi:ADP-heptose:LPS heptosyltransferase
LILVRIRTKIKNYFNVLLLFIQTSSQAFDTVVSSSGDKQIISISISLKIKKYINKNLKNFHKFFLNKLKKKKSKNQKENYYK